MRELPWDFLTLRGGHVDIYIYIKAIERCLLALHKPDNRQCTRKRPSHRETKRAPRENWRGRRVRNGDKISVQVFMECEASLEARVTGRWRVVAKCPIVLDLGLPRHVFERERASP